MTLAYRAFADGRVIYGETNARSMGAPRRTAADRRREAEEAARRDARRSIRLGVLGTAVLFLSGVGVWLLPEYVFGFLAGMVVGIVLLLAAFFLVRGSVLTLKGGDQTKLY